MKNQVKEPTRLLNRILLLMLFALPCTVLNGCAHDNGIIIKGSKKSTTAENIEAGGNVLGGAWDRLMKKEK